MEYLFFGIFYPLSGFLMKLSDDAFDERSDKKLAVISGIISGLIIGFLAVNSLDAAYIFLAILFGSFFSKKIDGIHHILTLTTFFLVLLFFGIPELVISTLFICSLAAYLDELGNDNIQLEKHDFWKSFFKYRFTLKLLILLLGIAGYLKMITGFSIPYMDFLSPSAIFYFILFEISYELSGFSFNRVYRNIYRFLDVKFLVLCTLLFTYLCHFFFNPIN